jgi:GT2 family glycosyltransferase
MRRAVVDSLGLFDPRYFLYYEEVDHCRAVKAAGWEVLYYPGTTVVHVGGESAKSVSRLSGAKQISELQTESELLYFRKHHGWLGVWVGLILTGVADALNICKAALRRRSADASGFAEFRTALRAFSRTSHGRMPTR